MIAQPAPKNLEISPHAYPQAKLEMAFIEDYLNAKGYQFKDLHLLPQETVRALMIEACCYASSKLAEIETRSRLVNELHGNR